MPANDGDVNGLRAMDGATLDPAGAPYVLGFQAIAGTPDGGAPPAPLQGDASFCRDVMPIFRAKCAGGACHHAVTGTSVPAAGLLLETTLGVKNTAIGNPTPIVARGSNTGPRTATEPLKLAFGVDMPIIDPKDPGNSWLMYKVLLAQPRPVDQALDASTPACFAKPAERLVDPASLPMQPLADDERRRLGEFIFGRPMPFPQNLPDNVQSTEGDPQALPLTFDDLERIRVWIAQGANTDETCNACTE